jgi:hypothetical protein
MQKNEQSIKDLTKHIHVCILEISEGKEREKGVKGIIKETVGRSCGSNSKAPA